MSFGVPAVLDNRHFLSVGMAAPYGLVYCARVFLHVPVQQRDVISFRVFFLDLRLQVFVRLVVFRDDEKPRRVLVEPVHDARTNNAVYRAERRQIVQKRVHESAVFTAARRVHDHTLRLVNDGDVVVFVNYVKGNVFGFQREIFRRW